MGKKRERYLDIAKGIAIICIVLLHVEEGVFSTEVNVFIGNFMISMFFLTTGWLDANRADPIPLRTLMRKRWRQLGVPYLWWTGILLSFDLILYFVGYYDTYFIAREVYKSVTLRGIGTLWFIPALFGGEIIWNRIRSCQSLWIVGLIALSVTVALLNCYYHTIGSLTDSMSRIIDAPFRTMRNILIAWPGIAGGFICHKVFMKLRLEGRSRWLYLVLGLVISTIAYGLLFYWNIPYVGGILVNVICPLGILILAMALERLRIMHYFNYWGINSLALMVTHYSIVLVLCEMLNKYLTNEPHIHGYPAFAWFAVVMLIEYFICECITRKMPMTLGK